jgi:hypothetical protein
MEDNIKIDLKEIGWVVIDWIEVIHQREHWWVCGFVTEPLCSVEGK